MLESDIQNTGPVVPSPVTAAFLPAYALGVLLIVLSSLLFLLDPLLLKWMIDYCSPKKGLPAPPCCSGGFFGLYISPWLFYAGTTGEFSHGSKSRLPDAPRDLAADEPPFRRLS